MSVCRRETDSRGAVLHCTSVIQYGHADVSLTAAGSRF